MEQIKKIVYITREEQFPYLYENTDFTEVGIKNLIKEGESKTKQALRKIGLEGKPIVIYFHLKRLIACCLDMRCYFGALLLAR